MSEHTFSVTVNGKCREVRGERLTDLLAELGLDASTVAVERNGALLKRDEMARTVLRPGDRLEIVRMACGG